MTTDESATTTEQRVADVLFDLDYQDAHELGAYAEGDDSRLDWFDYRTFVRPVLDTDGQVVLKLDDKWDAPPTYVTAEDGELVAATSSTEYRQDELGAQITWTFLQDNCEITPMLREDTPFGDDNE